MAKYVDITVRVDVEQYKKWLSEAIDLEGLQDPDIAEDIAEVIFRALDEDEFCGEVDIMAFPQKIANTNLLHTGKDF